MGRRRQYASATERKQAQRQRQRAAVLQVPCVHIGALVTLYQGDAPTIAADAQGQLFAEAQPATQARLF